MLFLLLYNRRLPLFYAMEIALYMMFADDTTSAVYFVIVFVLTLVIILVSWAVLYLMSPARSIKGFVVKLFTVLDVRLIVAGLGIVLFSIISFVVETNKTYFIWHSLWHVCVMIGAWLLLFSAKFKVDMGLYGNMSMFADTRSFYIYTDPEAEENNGCDESALMTGSGNNLDELKKTN